MHLIMRKIGRKFALFLTSDKQNLLACPLQSWCQHSTPERMQKYPKTEDWSLRTQEQQGHFFTQPNTTLSQTVTHSRYQRSPVSPVLMRKIFVSKPLLLQLWPKHLCVEFPVHEKSWLESMLLLLISLYRVFF